MRNMKLGLIQLIIIIFMVIEYQPALAYDEYPAIEETQSPFGWIIRTESSAYRIVVTKDKKVYPVYYGPLFFSDYNDKSIYTNNLIEEIPIYGGLANKINILNATNQNHSQITDLEFFEGEVILLDGRPTLKIIQRDSRNLLEVVSYIRVLKEYNVLEKWITIKNVGKNSITINNLMSGNIILPTNNYTLTQLSGHELSEFQPFISEITPGLKIIENKTFKSNNNMPWFLIEPRKKNAGSDAPAWWGAIHYSGNWKIGFNYFYNSRTDFILQITAGVNFNNTQLMLHSGDSFTSPKLSFGYTAKGKEGAARLNAEYVRRAVLPKEHRNKLRPVIFNGWMAHGFNINDSILLKEAQVASKMGVELFVIDDGWYKGRTDSYSGLGDWEVDKKKFPNGLKPVIDKVHNMGMKFGLWVEPESVSPKSDTYREHPNWVLGDYKRGKLPYRIFLNLAKEEVYQHLFHVLDRLLSRYEIDFIKWDQNTILSDNVGWEENLLSKRQDVRVRFIQNVYRLVDTLRECHPNVLFESCSSGGGRVDLGMLSRMDIATPSDNTMSVDRLFIQYGYLTAMPANTMESWVIGDWQYQQDNKPSLSFKFDVAMSGLLGISAPILDWNLEDKKLAEKKIALYKKIRPIIQQGTLYRLVSPFNHNRCALQYNSNNKDSAIVFCYNLAQYVTASYNKKAQAISGAQLLDKGSTILKLQGLDRNKKYHITIAGQENEKGGIYSGDYLMNVGIEWPTNSPFDSRILLIKQTGE